MKIKKWDVYVTRRILDPALPMILKQCSVLLNDKVRPPTRTELLNGVRGKDAILGTLSDRIDANIIDGGWIPPQNY